MLFERWGATDDEVDGAVAGDHVVPGARLVATRSITLDAPPAAVFPWLRQMGFGRAGWYSYDLIDNLARRSAREIRAEWQDVSEGDPVPAGPIDFVAVLVEEPRAFVICTKPNPRIAFSLAYELRPTGSDATRLVTRARARIDAPVGRLIERFVLGPGDGLMVRRQLLGLRGRIEHNS